MAVVSKVQNSDYTNNSASANTSYKVFTLERTVAAGGVDSNKSSNFIYLDVSYTDATINGALKATLLVSFVPITGSVYIIPQGITTNYEYPITNGTYRNLYEHVQHPDNANYYNYFMVSFGINGSGLIDIYVNTPNYNGKLLASVKHIIFQ